jgi:replication-associated recombination protein RarA
MVEDFTVDTLHQALQSKGYICDKGRVRSVYAALMTKPIGGFFAFGPPGTGKTWIFELLAEILGTERFFQQVSPGTREEELIQDLLPDEDSKSGIKKELGVLPQAVRASQEGPAFLILDEWDKTRPTADAFLLDFLQNGRINYGDLNMQADMDNLLIGITLNDERDLNGPLQRRLPYLQFEPLHPSLVRQALIDSHADHPYIPAAVSLYVRCEHSAMDKACTIQELRNLLNAITVLGENADWDQLVLDHVTKSKDNHRMLKSAESVDVDDWDDGEIERLDPAAYKGVDADGEVDPTSPSLPTISEAKGYESRTDNDETPDLSESFAALKKKDDG